MESKIHSVYDSYHVVICNFCQRYGHKEEKCEDKQKGEQPTCGRCAERHKSNLCRSTIMKCVNCFERGISVGADHSVFDRDCRTYDAEKMRVKNNTDHGI